MGRARLGMSLWSERKHDLSAEQFPVSAYDGSLKNLKDLKEPMLYMKGYNTLRGSSHTGSAHAEWDQWAYYAVLQRDGMVVSWVWQ